MIHTLATVESRSWAHLGSVSYSASRFVLGRSFNIALLQAVSMAPLTTIRGFPTQPMQAWGAPSNKEAIPPSMTFMDPEDTLFFFFSSIFYLIPRRKIQDYPENVKEIIHKVQAYIFTRRIRVKVSALALRCLT